MAEEEANSETIVPNVQQTPNSFESSAQGGTESSCNKSLEDADELMEKGSNAVKECDYGEATDCFSRALEIRVAQYGELDPECVDAYYKYGSALLYKAQEEADPLVAVPKKEDESQQNSNKDGSGQSAINGESSAASVSSNADGSSNHQEEPTIDVASVKDQEEDDEDSDAEDVAEADEDESDLDLAWKMLDVARAIVEKHSGDTMEKVDILSALAEVALEREDIETSLGDYLKALSILERLVEPDSRRIGELNFRICLCLEIGSKALDAIPYCQKAISVCKSRVQRLMNEAKSLSGSTSTSDASESNPTVQHSSSMPQAVDSVSDKESEIETLTSLSCELEKKLEDLQHLVSNPTSILSDILGMVSAKARDAEKSAASSVLSSSQMGTVNSSGGFDSPTVSTAQTNGASGVTHLGVIGRGVKRVLINSGAADSSTNKKPALDPPPNKGDGRSS